MDEVEILLMFGDDDNWIWSLYRDDYAYADEFDYDDSDLSE